MINLSILIPTYNYKKGLIDILETIITCKKEDLDSIEVIIGDDSIDKIISIEELNYYKKYISNLKYFKNIKSGFLSNYNNLITSSQGKFYWLLCHNEILENTKASLSKILKDLKKNKNLYILPITKKYEFNLFNRINLNVRMKHTLNKSFLNFFFRNCAYILFINVIGPPSAIIVNKKINIRYRNDLKWLNDVDYYYKLFMYIRDSKEIEVFSRNHISVLSDQSFSDSITNLFKKDNKKFHKLKKLELLMILKSKKNIYIYNLIKSPIWIMFKIYSFFNLKIEFNRYFS